MEIDTIIRLCEAVAILLAIAEYFRRDGKTRQSWEDLLSRNSESVMRAERSIEKVTDNIDRLESLVQALTTTVAVVETRVHTIDRRVENLEDDSPTGRPHRAPR